MMKIAVLAIALVMGSIAFGQGAPATTPEERAYNLTTRMVTELALDGDQALKISDINMGIAQKNQAIRTATNMTADQKQEILLSNDAARLQMYRGILTTTQYTQAEAIEVEL